MAARITVFTILIGIFTLGFSQEPECGTQPTHRDIEDMRKLNVTPGLSNRIAAEPVKIAVTAHIVRRSNGTGGLTEQQLADAIVDVNEIYTLTNMEFFIFGDINFIDSDDYFDFNSSQEVELASQHFVENTINVYFFNSATSGENPVCGYARFPSSGIDRVIMVNSCTTNGSTFPHELGHYFSLYHTHGKTNTGTTDELVTREEGANCTSAGDDLCDTAADPNLSGLVDSGCNYTGSSTDENGDTYIPNPRNLMSYSRKECRDEFSQGQADRIVAAYQEYKTYLYDKNYSANFELLNREVCQGNSVEFTDKSVNAETYSWTFEGGNPSTSSDQSPMVSYSSVGAYDVTLEITDSEGGTDTKILEDYVIVKSSVTSESLAESGSFEEGIVETVYNDDESITWAATSNAASDGSESIYMDFYNYSSSGEVDYLSFATLNTSEEKTFALTFDYAYAAYDDSYFDGLEIVYRDPCGNWMIAWSKEGGDLATAPNQTSFFTPSSDQWKTETVLFLIDEEVNVTEFAFKSINGYGNALYVDNYSIETYDASFSIESASTVNASCIDVADGSVTVLVDSEGSFTYSPDGENYIESNEITGLLPGTYTISVKNILGVEETTMIEIGYDNEYPEMPVIEVTETEFSVVIEEGQTVQWYVDENPIEGATETSLVPDGHGSFSVAVSNGGCATFSDPYIILGANILDSELKIFPNPVQEILHIGIVNSLGREVNEISIHDVSGKKLMVQNLVKDIDVSDLKSGIYFIQFEFEHQKVTRRFLKQ